MRDLNEMMPDLKEAYYSFDHPTFEGNVSTSTNRSNGFRVEYLGWGCVSKVTATLVFKDDSRLAKSFDQCAVLPPGTQVKGGWGFVETSNAPNLPPRKCDPGEVTDPPAVQGPPPCIP